MSEINVTNNVAGLNISVNEVENGIAITLAKNPKRTLGEVEVGSTVKLGKSEYIVLEQDNNKNQTSVISKEIVVNMAYGKTGDYIESEVRKYCNGSFFCELSQAVGKENILYHKVDLISEDGTGKNKSCIDNISILTADLYRKYRDYLPACGEGWCTCTKLNEGDEDFVNEICIISPSGLVLWGDSSFKYGVRPYCILRQTIQI